LEEVLVKIALVFLLATGLSAFGQNCAYTFTYNAAEFRFCVTSFGTIGSLQSPVGTEHLGSVEGWSIFTIDNDGGGKSRWHHITGLSAYDEGLTPRVRQPGGSGKLPLIFEWTDSFGMLLEQATITAVPAQRIVNIVYTLKPGWWNEPPQPDNWTIFVSRVAEIRADGLQVGKFANSSFAAFGYNTAAVGPKHGVKLGVKKGTTARWGGHAGVAHQPAY